jgi:hypothetical protein
VYILVTGIESNSSSSEFTVMPNPFVDQFTVSIGGAAGSIEIDVYDVTGQKVFSQHHEKNDGIFSVVLQSSEISFLPGIYLLRVQLNGKEFLKRIIRSGE